jgi:hypothetical protein
VEVNITDFNKPASHLLAITVSDEGTGCRSKRSSRSSILSSGSALKIPTSRGVQAWASRLAGESLTYMVETLRREIWPAAVCRYSSVCLRPPEVAQYVQPETTRWWTRIHPRMLALEVSFSQRSPPNEECAVKMRSDERIHPALERHISGGADATSCVKKCLEATCCREATNRANAYCE